MYICDEMMIERQRETIQSDCSMNCGLRLMRKSTYHIRAWTHTREKPPLGGDLLHYPLLQRMTFVPDGLKTDDILTAVRSEGARTCSSP